MNDKFRRRRVQYPVWQETPAGLVCKTAAPLPCVSRSGTDYPSRSGLPKKGASARHAPSSSPGNRTIKFEPSACGLISSFPYYILQGDDLFPGQTTISDQADIFSCSIIGANTFFMPMDRVPDLYTGESFYIFTIYRMNNRGQPLEFQRHRRGLEPPRMEAPGIPVEMFLVLRAKRSLLPFFTCFLFSEKSFFRWKRECMTQKISPTRERLKFSVESYGDEFRSIRRR